MAVLSLPSLSALSWASVLSWRNLVLLFLVLNLKNIPLFWHFRLIYVIWRHRCHPDAVRKAIANHKPSEPYPLFAPVSIFSRSPLLETDWNAHKSNSTFFSDLDISRGALVTKLLWHAGSEGARALDRQGYKGKVGIPLGSVHISFRREIKPYERYEVRSRLLGWDRKWLVIGSYFIRPKTGEVLASALSKYVIKKGRFTVPPENCLRRAGWLPERPGILKQPSSSKINSATNVSAVDGGADSVDRDEDATPTPQTTPTTGTSTTANADQLVSEAPPTTNQPVVCEKESTSAPTTDDAIAAPVAGTVQAASMLASTVERLEAAAASQTHANPDDEGSAKKTTSRSPQPVAKWDWHRIDEERRRGIKLAEGWLTLDAQLMAAFNDDSTTDAGRKR